MGVVSIALSDFRSQPAGLSELHLASVGVSEFRCECIIKVLLVIRRNFELHLASAGVSEFRCECIINVLLVIHRNIGTPLGFCWSVGIPLRMHNQSSAHNPPEYRNSAGNAFDSRSSASHVGLLDFHLRYVMLLRLSCRPLATHETAICMFAEPCHECRMPPCMCETCGILFQAYVYALTHNYACALMFSLYTTIYCPP